MDINMAGLNFAIIVYIKVMQSLKEFKHVFMLTISVEML